MINIIPKIDIGKDIIYLIKKNIGNYSAIQIVATDDESRFCSFL